MCPLLQQGSSLEGRELYDSLNRGCMFGRIADAVTTRLLPYVKDAVREEFDARSESLDKEAREIIQEMNDLLEKFSRVVAREAKRKTREAKSALGGDGSADPSPATPEAANNGHLSPEQRKAQIWSRMRGGAPRRVVGE